MENLPKGKYIVCAEAWLDQIIIQNNCFETLVDRHDDNSKSFLLNLILKQNIICTSYILNMPTFSTCISTSL